MRIRPSIALLVIVAGCHGPAPTAAPIEDAGGGSDAPARRPQVQLTWRLFETDHALDANGEDTASAVFELLVNGGTPSRVALGRRRSLGCIARDTPEEPSRVATLECHAHAHGEYVHVVRLAPGELRIEAFGQDEALLDHEPPRTAVQTATVKIPLDAEVVADPTIAIVPDEVRPK
ncbi:MAG TPA: hypothetical protein VH044_00095 [Polyangiaceae bacterium]|nr:hypothetical protein [Polyangiaceae bacterium]